MHNTRPAGRPRKRGPTANSVDTELLETRWRARTDLPGGTVTLLFTDIEGSTRLLRQRGDAYPAVLRAHHDVLRACFDSLMVELQAETRLLGLCRAGGVDDDGSALWAVYDRFTEGFETRDLLAAKALLDGGAPV